MVPADDDRDPGAPAGLAVPAQESGWFFVGRNDGTQAQDVVYVADSLQGLLDGGRVLIDPNKLSEDGTDSLGSYTVSPDGRYFAYGLNESGSDWITFRLLEVATGAEVDDVVTQAKFCEATWLPDSSAYLYLHYPASGRGEGTETKALGGGQLKLHKVGTPQEDDQLILSFPENDRIFIGPEVSDDDRYLVVTISEGTDPATRLWLYPIADGGLGEPIKVIDEFRDETAFVRMSGDRLVLRTDRDASRGRVVTSDLAGTFTDLIPEGEGALQSVRGTAAGLAVLSLIDAQPVLSLYDLDGGKPRVVPVPGGGVVGLNASPKHDEVFVGLSSTTDPTVSYVVSAASGEFRALPELVPAGAGFTSPEITVTRRVEPGREVPYFLISRADLTFDQPRPTLMWGYGGFRIPVLADYRPGWPAWLAAAWRAGDHQPARRWGVRQFLARRGTPGEQAERLRRLHRGRRAPPEDQGDHAAATSHPRPQQRRPAGRRGDDPAAGPVRGRAARGRRDGHAAVPPVHGGGRVGVGLRTAGRRRAVRGPGRLLAAAQPACRYVVPGDPGRDRRPRRPGGAAAQSQVHGDAAARAGRMIVQC